VRPYVIRRPRPAAVTPLFGLVAIAVFVLVLDIDFPVPPLWILVVGGAFAVYEAWRTTLVLRVDGKGVLLGRRPNRRTRQPNVPWSSIHEVALTETDPQEIEVRLRLGAPLPDGVAGAVHDPSRQYGRAPQLRMPVPGADRATLAAAVQHFGGVPLRSA
jgi:hypothetical protein